MSRWWSFTWFLDGVLGIETWFGYTLGQLQCIRAEGFQWRRFYLFSLSAPLTPRRTCICLCLHWMLYRTTRCTHFFIHFYMGKGQLFHNCFALTFRDFTLIVWSGTTKRLFTLKKKSKMEIGHQELSKHVSVSRISCLHCFFFGSKNVLNELSSRCNFFFFSQCIQNVVTIFTELVLDPGQLSDWPRSPG